MNKVGVSDFRKGNVALKQVIDDLSSCQSQVEKVNWLTKAGSDLKSGIDEHSPRSTDADRAERHEHIVRLSALMRTTMQSLDEPDKQPARLGLDGNA